MEVKYDYCDVILGRIRHLNSEEKQQMNLWFRKKIDTIARRQPYAIADFHDLQSIILVKGVFEGYWKNIDEAKKFALKLLRYVRKYEPVPKVNHRVEIPEHEFPPFYQIARMKSMGYSDERIIKEAKEKWGFEETAVMEIIKDRINVITSFDLKTFCEDLEKKQKD